MKLKPEQRTFIVYAIMCLALLFLICSKNAYEAFCLCPKGGLTGMGHIGLKSAQQRRVNRCDYSNDFAGVV